MSSAADSLLRDIAAAPDDDAPRLVYADWFSNTARRRGEFIALSCMSLVGAEAVRRDGRRVVGHEKISAVAPAAIRPDFGVRPGKAGRKGEKTCGDFLKFRSAVQRVRYPPDEDRP